MTPQGTEEAPQKGQVLWEDAQPPVQEEWHFHHPRHVPNQESPTSVTWNPEECFQHPAHLFPHHVLDPSDDEGEQTNRRLFMDETRHEESPQCPPKETPEETMSPPVQGTHNRNMEVEQEQHERILLCPPSHPFSIRFSTRLLTASFVSDCHVSFQGSVFLSATDNEVWKGESQSRSPNRECQPQDTLHQDLLVDLLSRSDTPSWSKDLGEIVTKTTCNVDAPFTSDFPVAQGLVQAIGEALRKCTSSQLLLDAMMHSGEIHDPLTFGFQGNDWLIQGHISRDSKHIVIKFCDWKQGFACQFLLCQDGSHALTTAKENTQQFSTSKLIVSLMQSSFPSTMPDRLNLPIDPVSSCFPNESPHLLPCITMEDLPDEATMQSMDSGEIIVESTKSTVFAQMPSPDDSPCNTAKAKESPFQCSRETVTSKPHIAHPGREPRPKELAPHQVTFWTRHRQPLPSGMTGVIFWMRASSHKKVNDLFGNEHSKTDKASITIQDPKQCHIPKTSEDCQVNNPTQPVFIKAAPVEQPPPEPPPQSLVSQGSSKQRKDERLTKKGQVHQEEEESQPMPDHEDTDSAWQVVSSIIIHGLGEDVKPEPIDPDSCSHQEHPREVNAQE